MAEARIPVDVFNPGQVFACLGLMEMADVLLGGAVGAFDWNNRGDSNVWFTLKATGGKNPVREVFDYLIAKDTKIFWLSPVSEVKERDGGETRQVNQTYTAPENFKSTRMRGVIQRGEFPGIPIGYWADDTLEFNVIFKSPTNGCSPHRLFQNNQTAIREIENFDDENPFSLSVMCMSNFRLDKEGYVTSVDAGFSPDKMRKGYDVKGGIRIPVRLLSNPFVDILAVIGLTWARPKKVSSNRFTYFIWKQCSLPVMLARSALGIDMPFLEQRSFIVFHEIPKGASDRVVREVLEQQ